MSAAPEPSPAEPQIALRPPTVADAERLARLVIEGFERYGEFAPAGFTPPPLEPEVERLRELLGDPRVWSRLAEVDGRSAGQITMLPASIAGIAVDDGGLIHLRNLFVEPEFWGTGVARALHDAGLVEARERGFPRARLFTPAGNARARRFYEREGWTQAAEEFFEARLGLALVEYRYALREPSA